MPTNDAVADVFWDTWKDLVYLAMIDLGESYGENDDAIDRLRRLSLAAQFDWEEALARGDVE